MEVDGKDATSSDEAGVRKDENDHNCSQKHLASVAKEYYGQGSWITPLFK